MTRSFRLIAFLGTQLLFTRLAHAESDTIKAHIPFAFSAGGKSLPAGDYVIDTVAGGGGLMLRGTSQEALATVLTITPSPSVGHTGLSFVHRGSDYILSAVELPNGRVNLPTSHTVRGRTAPIPMTSATILPRQ